MQPYSLDDVNALLLGRPPFLPFALAASVLASDLALPPLLPSLEKWALMICLGVIQFPLHCQHAQVSTCFIRRNAALGEHSITCEDDSLSMKPRLSVTVVSRCSPPDESTLSTRWSDISLSSDLFLSRMVFSLRREVGMAPAFKFRAQLLRELEHLLLVCHHVSFRNQQGHYNPSGLGCQIGRVDSEVKPLILLSKSARKNIYFLDLEVKGK